MAIESPATYGDFYNRGRVDAALMQDENIEFTFAPYFAGLFADMPDIADLPTGLQTLIRNLAEPPSAGFGGFALGVGVEMVDETLHTLLNPIMKMMGRSVNRRAKETWLTSQQVNTLFQRGYVDEDFWKLNIESEGYEDVIGKFLYQAQLPYPAIADIMLYARYHGDPENTRDVVWEKFDVPARDYDLWEWLTLQRLTINQAQILFKRGKLSQAELYNELAKIGWSATDRRHIEELGWAIPNAMLLTQGNLQRGVASDKILKDISIADIHPQYAQTYLDGILTKPASTDLVAYNLRKDPELSDLEPALRKIGIHPEYVDIYRTLAYQIPPVADIITMAVREAFTPAIAERFGQYEDFPEPFAEWAAKKGLTKDWAERYWAAHWALPSSLQGFEMLHRGIINRDELNMLLRALDVMPFWRDKLVQMAYKRITRVDVRRMYRTGVLDEAGVLQAYLDLGYNDRDAKRMTDFTVQQNLQVLSKFTSSDVIKAYVKRMITKSEAQSLLSELGIAYTDQRFIISTADYKKDWEFTDSKIAGIRNLYRKRVYDENKARAELLKLDLPSEQVDVLMEQWYYDVKAEPVRTWTTAQTIAFIKEGLITRERGIAELKQIGYDTEHINVYMGSLK